MKLSTVLLSLLVGWTGPGLSAARAAPAVPVALEASSPAGVRFRVAFSPPRWVDATAGDRTYHYPAWDRLASDAEPGYPAIPTTLVRVALPPAGDPTVSVETETLGRAAGVRFPPAPMWERPEIPAPRDGRVVPRSVTREGDAYRTGEAGPYAEITNIGIERGLRVATVAVHPVRWDPRTGEAEWIAAASVTLSLPGAPRAVPARGRPDTVGEAAWGRELVNPGDAPAFRAMSAAADTIPLPPGPDGIPATWFDKSSGWAKIQVTGNGVYRLTRQMLEDAGVPVATLDPRTLRLYSGPLLPEVGWAAMGWDTLSCSAAGVLGKRPPVYERPGFEGGFQDPGGFGQIAIWVRGEADGIFDSGDDVVFYGLGPDNYRDRFGLPLDTLEDYLINPYTDHTVYWLAWGGSLPGTPARMQTLDASPGAGTPLTTSEARVHAERNTIQDPSMYLGGYRWEEWFWEFLSSDNGAQQFFVDLPHLVSGTDLEAHVRFWGAKVPTQSDGGDARLHHVRVMVDDRNVGLFSWGGSSPQASITPYDVTVPPVAAADPAKFQFQVPEVASTDPYRLDLVYLTWIDVRYRRALDLDGAAGELEIAAGAPGRTVTLASVPTGTVLLFDVTDFRNPRRLEGAAVSGTDRTLSVAGGGRTILAAAVDGNLPAPDAVVLDRAPEDPPGSGTVHWLRDTGEALDYVIIAADGMVQAAEELAGHRREYLFPITPDRPARVRVVAISDIMDEFAWGMWDPMAISHFLEYAYRYYGSAVDDRLSYCLFLGDATNDPRDYGGTGAPDLVPSWEDNRDTIARITFGSVQYVSDDPLAQFDPPDARGCPDVVTDLYIGRIPASSPAQALDLIRNKVIRSETDPDYGPWRLKAILVADDNCQGTRLDGIRAYTHMNQTEAVSNRLSPLFDQEKVYLYEYGNDCVYTTKPAAKQALIQAWSGGAWLVNYIGHGADVVWADEHVLDLSDTPLLANDRRYPVVGSFSCSVGKFSNPGRDGLAESHLLAPHGGALVSAAATQVTSSFSNSLFNLEFVDRLFPNGPFDAVPAGVAMMDAKRVRALPKGDTDKYVCLGDPASRLTVPSGPLELAGPSTLERGATVTVKATVPGAGGRSGTLDVLARDARRLVTTDEDGVPIPTSYGWYTKPGAVLFRGRDVVQGDSASAVFTVPASLRGGADGKIRTYAWGKGWDAAAVLSPLTVGQGEAVATSDTTGPAITFPVGSGAVSPGETLELTLADPSGINLTRLFEFRSILLRVTDRDGLERYRQDLTDRFAYDSGSHTRGRLDLVVPDLESAPYTFSISATDNLNNRSQIAVDLEVGTIPGGAAFEDVPGAYPNPFDPEAGPTQLLFSLSRSAEVTVRVYSVAGRLVRKRVQPGTAGPNIFVWDGRDQAGDLVANGVYLVQLAAEAGSGEVTRHLERLVVLR